MYDVTALGELLIDFTWVHNDKEGYPTLAAHPGGGPLNLLAALSKLGAKTALIAKVGEDAFGSLLRKTLKELGIDDKGVITDRSVFTTLAFVTLDETGDRGFSFARKPGSDTCLRYEEMDVSCIDAARAFHFSSLSLTHEPARTATQKAVAYAARRGKLIHFDPNLREPLWEDLEEAKNQILWGLQMADVVKISREEAEFLFGLSPEASAAHILQTYAAKLVFVTCGKDGVYYANRRCSGHTPGLSGIRAVDTTGAGDIFGGSALWKLLETGKAPEDLDREDLERITAFACAAAGLSTTLPGGTGSMPDRARIEACLK